VGSSGYIKLTTGLSPVSGKGGDMNFTVGLGSSGRGGRITLMAGNTTGATGGNVRILSGLGKRSSSVR